MMDSRPLTAVLILATVSVILWGGCNDPEAARATAVRQEKVRRTFGLFAARETDSPRRMDTTLGFARQLEQRHAERCIQNGRRLREWAQHDIERWEANQPVYRERTAEELAGDTAGILWAFRTMFY